MISMGISGMRWLSEIPLAKLWQLYYSRKGSTPHVAQTAWDSTAHHHKLLGFCRMERCIKISYVLDLLSSHSAKIHMRHKEYRWEFGCLYAFLGCCSREGKEQGSPVAEAVDWVEHTYARQVVVQRWFRENSHTRESQGRLTRSVSVLVVVLGDDSDRPLYVQKQQQSACSKRTDPKTDNLRNQQ